MGGTDIDFTIRENNAPSKHEHTLTFLENFASSSFPGIKSSGCGIFELQELYMENHSWAGAIPLLALFPKLRQLDIHYNDEIKNHNGNNHYNLLAQVLLEVARLEKIKTVTISCDSLETLPKEVGQLIHVRKLVINNCHHLQTLPNSIGKLNRLQSLEVSCCEALQSIPSNTLGRLTNLRRMEIRWCDALINLPSDIFDGQQAKPTLEDLEVMHCDSLIQLPSTIGQLKKLTELKLACRSLRELPPDIGNLEELISFTLFNCQSLTEVPPEVGRLLTLQRFKIEDCRSIFQLPPQVRQLPNLETLDFFSTTEPPNYFTKEKG